MAEKKIQLEIQADASGVQAGVATAKKSIHSLGEAAQQAGEKAAKMGDGAQQSAQKVDASTKNMIASIQRTIATMEAGGRANSKYFETLAQQRGVDVNALRPYLDQLDKVSEKQRQAAMEAAKASGAFNKYGKSAKEVELALRGVPAQITDIIVSLQGGQAPLTVLLQQGGQLRDMFGGIAPAAKALGGAVLGLINPFTVAAGAAGALAAAYLQGSKEADAYARSIVLTGNAVGATVGQLQAMSAAIDATVGTQRRAAEVINALAETGQVSVSNLQALAEAAIRVERVTGKAAEDIVKEFAKLGESPVKAVQKLNEEYNFLTLEVYEHIRALEEQGRVAEAASVAQNAFADALAERADRLTERLGYVERAWRAIKDAAAESWDAMLDIGRPDTPEQRLASLQAQLEQRLVRGPLNALTTSSWEKGNQALREQIELLQADLREQRRYATAQAETAEAVRAAIEAEKAIEKIREQSRNKQAELNDALKEYHRHLDAIRRADPNSALLDPKEIAKVEAQLREKYAERNRAYRDDAATRMLQQLREAEAAARLRLEVGEQLTESQRKLAEFERLIADLKEKRTLTADQKSLLAAEEAIKAQLRQNVAVEQELRLKDQLAQEEKRRAEEQRRFEERLAQLRESMASNNQGRREQYDAQLGVVGLGSQAREQLQAQIAIQREFRRYREQLDKATPKELLGSGQYKEAVAEIKAQLDDALAANRRYFKQMEALQANATVGAQEATLDYINNAKNAARQTYEATSNAFQAMEDALVRFVTTGKLSFKDFVNTILADLARVTFRRGIAGVVGDGFDLGSVIGSIISGFRANGGPVEAGKAYVVGERGPELFVPKSGGQVIANGAVVASPAPKVSVQVVNNTGVQASPRVEQRSDGMIRVVLDRVAEDIRVGGDVAAALQGTYGLSRGAGVPRRSR